MLFGMAVYVDDTSTVKPRMQVSDEFRRLQSPELVEATNQWMLSFFGVNYVAYKAGDVLVVHSNTLAEMKRAAFRDHLNSASALVDTWPAWKSGGAA